MSLSIVVIISRIYLAIIKLNHWIVLKLYRPGVPNPRPTAHYRAMAYSEPNRGSGGTMSTHVHMSTCTNCGPVHMHTLVQLNLLIAHTSQTARTCMPAHCSCGLILLFPPQPMHQTLRLGTADIHLRLSLRKMFIFRRHLVAITNSIKDIADKSTAFKIVQVSFMLAHPT